MPVHISLTDRLKTQHLTIYELINDVPGQLLFRHPAPGKWNINDQIAHLARYQMIFLERINLILSEQRPLIKRYDAEQDNEFAGWQKMSVEKLMKRLVSDRLKLFNLITRLDKEKLILTGIHEKYGELTVLQWTEFFLLHEAHHLYTLFQITNNMDHKTG